MTETTKLLELLALGIPPGAFFMSGEIMINITDTAAMARTMALPIDPELRQLLEVRCDQLLEDTNHEYELGELVHFIVASSSDAVAEIEAMAGYPLITEPAFEWVADHGRWYEAVTILSDDGFGIVLFVPNLNGMDPRLLTLLRAEAIATTAAADRAQSQSYPSPLT